MLFVRMIVAFPQKIVFGEKSKAEPVHMRQARPGDSSSFGRAATLLQFESFCPFLGAVATEGGEGKPHHIE